MTEHPCKGMAPRQIETFEQVATGNALPGTSKRNLDLLEKRGLIQRGPDRRLRDRFGSYLIPQYSIPLNIYTQWCEWCSEQSGTEP